jgi:hypothetical protein
MVQDNNINIHSYQVRWEPYEHMHKCDMYEINDLQPMYNHLARLIDVIKISIYFNYSQHEYSIPFRMRIINDTICLKPDYDWSCRDLNDNIKDFILNEIKNKLDPFAGDEQPFSSYLVA